MKLVALVFCLAMAALGAYGVAAPERLIALMRRFHSRNGLYLAAAIRLGMGAAFYLAGPESQSPQVVRGLGVFVFVAGLVTPFIGVERFGALLNWWATRGSAFVRAWSLFVVALGLALATLLVP